MAKYRSAFKDIAKQFGRQIFSGSMDLSKVTFPIKCMIPRTILRTLSLMAAHVPIYMNAAA